MRTVNVPAEVMSVRDTIMGKMTLEQLGLLMLAGLGMGYVYMAVEPAGAMSWAKLAGGLTIAVGCVFLAWRKDDKLMLEWLGLGLAYWLRPKKWVYDKRTEAYRLSAKTQKLKNAKTQNEVGIGPVARAAALPVGLVSRGQVRKEIRFNLSRRGALYVAKAK